MKSNITILNDGSVEQKSLCLALIRQYQSSNTPDLRIFAECDYDVFPNSFVGGFQYNNYREDDWIGKIANNIPDWPILKLNPKILEKLLSNITIKNPIFGSDNFASWFLFAGAPEGRKF